MKTFRLTLAQLRNLKELRDDLEGKLPPTILTKVPPRQLARWLRNPPFRDRVEALLEVVRFRQDNALDLAATRAAEQISAALADKAGIDTPELRPLAEIIKLALAARSSKARRQRTAENSKNRRNEKILQPPPLPSRRGRRRSTPMSPPTRRASWSAGSWRAGNDRSLPPPASPLPRR